MAIISAEKLVKTARDNEYTVGRFNINNPEWTQTILHAAEAKRVPILIQTSIGATECMGGYRLYKALTKSLAESMGIAVLVAIHFDHGHLKDALECIEIGYTSVMPDSLHLPFEENLEKAREVVAKAYAKGISIEVEVGTIGGEESGVTGDGELAPTEGAKVMVATGIGLLATNIGNIHGPYPTNWKGLHLDHPEKLTAAVLGFPIVLHGGSGILDDQIQTAIKLGVAKVSVNTECQLTFAKVTRKLIAEYEADEEKYNKKKFFDSRKFLKPGFEAITGAAKERIDVFGSANKA